MWKSVIAVTFLPWKCNSDWVEDENYQSPVTEQIMISIFATVSFPNVIMRSWGDSLWQWAAPPCRVAWCVCDWSSFCALGCFLYFVIIMLSVGHTAKTPRKCRIAPLDKREKWERKHSLISYTYKDKIPLHAHSLLFLQLLFFFLCFYHPGDGYLPTSVVKVISPPWHRVLFGKTIYITVIVTQHTQSQAFLTEYFTWKPKKWSVFSFVFSLYGLEKLH